MQTLEISPMQCIIPGGIKKQVKLRHQIKHDKAFHFRPISRWNAPWEIPQLPLNDPESSSVSQCLYNNSRAVRLSSNNSTMRSVRTNTFIYWVTAGRSAQTQTLLTASYRLSFRSHWWRVWVMEGLRWRWAFLCTPAPHTCVSAPIRRTSEPRRCSSLTQNAKRDVLKNVPLLFCSECSQICESPEQEQTSQGSHWGKN